MIAGLDGVRGLAVLLVLLFHNGALDAGWIGVQIFFVLSGFLITRLLVRQKDAPLGAYLKNFYGRRFLRIFPAYYACLIALWAAMHWVETTKANELVYAFTYTYDFYHASRRFVHTPLLSHFWSLAIEEQFYLVWPAVVFACPRDRLKYPFAAIAVLGPLVRLVTFVLLTHERIGSGNPWRDVYVLPTSHFDAFAMGGLLCVAWPRISRALFLSALGTFVALVVVQKWITHARSGLLIGLPHAYEYAWGYSIVDVLAGMLIVVVADGTFATSFFRWRPMSYLGKISYGVYLFHYPLTLISGPLSRRLVPSPEWAPYASFAIDFAAAFLVAAVSFELMERPLLRWKDRWFGQGAEPAAPRR
jgi:peptidoglycan/LPS O-acetylase OafA/YrhL